MITILPADEKEYSKIGVTDATVRAMVVSGGDTTEYITFRLYDTEMELLELHATDFVIQEGLVRAALNYGFRREKERAFCTDFSMEPILKFLLFSKQETGYSVSLSEFFSRGCKRCGNM